MKKNLIIILLLIILFMLVFLNLNQYYFSNVDKLCLWKFDQNALDHNYGWMALWCF